MDIVKRLRPALREPRAVGLECGKVVVDHFIPLLDEAGTAEEFDSPQRRRDTEISAEKTKESKDFPVFPSWDSVFVFSALISASLRGNMRPVVFQLHRVRDSHPHHFMPNLSKYQSSVRSRRASISLRRNEISPSTRSAMASPKASCLCSARTALARRGAERWANARRNRLCRYCGQPTGYGELSRKRCRTTTCGAISRS